MPPDTLPAPPTAPLATTIPVRNLNSQQLFDGTGIVEIIHAGQRYILRITRENRLILTK